PSSQFPVVSYYYFFSACHWQLATGNRQLYLPCLFLIMNLFFFFLLLVFVPLVPCPHGVTGWRPPEVRPSPPPCGWSTGFIATPRTQGRMPSQRERPALPITSF